jgi:hypothetical protein
MRLHAPHFYYHHIERKVPGALRIAPILIIPSIKRNERIAQHLATDFDTAVRREEKDECRGRRRIVV